jgi:hypothetical protein
MIKVMEIKNKTCPICGNSFKPFRTFQKCCTAECTRKHAESKQKQKEERKTYNKAQERKNKLELARIAFNAFIRERDKNKPCICCGETLGENFQAGHYYSGGGHSSVIFDEDNVHAQKWTCNNEKAGNNTAYGVRLEKKLGKTGFELLRARAYDPKKWEIEELDAIIYLYRQKLKELKAL